MGHIFLPLCLEDRRAESLLLLCHLSGHLEGAFSGWVVVGWAEPQLVTGHFLVLKCLKRCLGILGDQKGFGMFWDPRCTIINCLLEISEIPRFVTKRWICVGGHWLEQRRATETWFSDFVCLFVNGHCLKLLGHISCGMGWQGAKIGPNTSADQLASFFDPHELFLCLNASCRPDSTHPRSEYLMRKWHQLTEGQVIST